MSDSTHQKTSGLATELNRYATPLTGDTDDYTEIIEMAKDANYVLLGEASHGTHDFYRIRAEITQRLIAEEGFMAVAVEADWPDAYRINRYVRGDSSIDNAEDALSDFTRFPQWMWCNIEVRNFIDWLYDYNHLTEQTIPVGFFGMDIYSLNSSSQAVIRYLEKIDSAAAQRARMRYGCFDSYVYDPQQYGYATALNIQASCEQQIIAQLKELQTNAFAYLQRDSLGADEEFFSAEQNARLVANAEAYYRALFKGRAHSWNLRDTHMADTLDALADHLARRYSRPAKIVVWAHNSHLGDATATEPGARGEINIGNLMRKRHPHKTLLIGFTTYNGSVTAAADWDEPAEHMRVRDALAGSVEELFHRMEPDNFLLNLKDNPHAQELLAEPRLERFIGVIYRPDTERASHYYPVRLAQQFDVVLHLDHTRALTPLDPGARWEAAQAAQEAAQEEFSDNFETYPTGL